MGKKGEGETFLFNWVNFPSAWYIGSSQESQARSAVTFSCEGDNGNCDDLGCKGNTALGSSFMYTSPIQL